MHISKQAFPVTVTKTSEDYLVAKLDYFNQPILLQNYSFNKSTNELDNLYLSLVERLLEVPYLENQVIKVNLEAGFPNILNLLSKSDILNKEKCMEFKAAYLHYKNPVSGNFVNSIIVDNISITEIPHLIALNAFLGLYDNVENFKSFVLTCLNITAVEKATLDLLLTKSVTTYPRLVFLTKEKNSDDLTVEDFNFEL